MAHGNDYYELKFQVVDFIPSSSVNGFFKVSLLSKDSVLLKTGSRRIESENGAHKLFYILPVDSSGSYIIKCEHEDYHTLYKPIDITLRKREHVILLEKLRMKRRLKEDMTIDLEGVEVLGSKIKFYFDKDTLVYNASAFITQKGLVLNDILKKMPGVELRDDGNIYCNGERVKSLLLNGKDFFQNDRKTLLENLPAFMVKNVKVYNKTKDSLSVFQREREFEGLVMDVKLKKEYHRSWLATADVAAGTDDGYYGKLFGMTFSDLHRLSVFAGTNNVNKNEDLKEGEHASNSDMGVGRNKYSKAGLNYNVDNSQGKYSLSGDVTIDYSDQNAEQMNSTRMFSKDGDMFSRSFNHERFYALGISTNHEFNLWQNTPYSLTLSPSFSHHRVKQRLNSAQGTFHEDLGHLYGEKWLDSIMANVIGEQMLQYGVSRQIVRTKSDVESTEAKLLVTKTIMIPHSNDRLNLSAETLYGSSKTKNFRSDNVDYIGTGAKSGDWNYHYLTPNENQWKASGSAEYVLKITEKNALKAVVSFEHKENDVDNPVYKLHEIDNASTQSYAFGVLPPADILCGVSDVANSYTHTLKDNNLKAKLRYEYDFKRNIDPINNLRISFFGEVPFKVYRSRVHFVQNQTNESVSNQMICPDVELGFSYNKKGMKNVNLSANYKQVHEMASPLQMIDIYDDTNPMMTRHGNKDLKDKVTHTISFNAFLNNMMKWDHIFVVSYSVEKNSILNSILFNKTTGAWNVTPKNVNGNKSLTFMNYSNYSLPRHWSLQNKTLLMLADLVTYSGMNMNEYSQENLSHWQKISQSVTVEKMSANMKHRVSLSPFVSYNHTGNRRNLQKNMENWEYGVNGSISLELPWDLKYETDLNAVRRSGFAFNDLNKSEYVWNMNLRKSFGEKIALGLEVNDLLNQKHYVTNVVTPQMEMENQFNHLGRYAMFHVVYKFTKGKQQ